MKKSVFFLLLVFVFPQIVWAKTSNDPQIQQWSYNDVHAFGAWDIQSGSRDVVVAVIDNGFDTFHPDLADNVWKNFREIVGNGLDDDNNGYVDDVWGWNFANGNNDPRPNIDSLTTSQKEDGVFNHGTVVAGIIGAVGDNGLNGAGINWKVKLMNVKVIDNSGTGDLVLLGPAIRYAVNNGASLINISMVGNFIQSDVLDAIRYANDHGVALFAAAGNDGRFLDEQPRYPVCADQSESKQLILGVSAMDETHHLAPFSNYGSHCIDITAPGTNIFSTLRYDSATGLSSQYGGPWNGTSFATPFVTGAAALIKAIQPTWQAPEIYNALLSTVHKTAPVDDAVYTHLFGKGLLQIDKAVQYALSAAPIVPVEPTVPVIPPVIVPSSTPVSPTIVETLSVMIFNDATAKGEIYKYGVQNGFGSPLETKTFADLQGLESISRYKKPGNESMYGILYFRSDGNSIVRLYNSKFERMGGYKKKLAFASTLVLADMIGNDEPENVLAPKTADTLLFSVSDKNGKELVQVKSPLKHSGVNITRRYNPQTKKDDIVVLYKQGTRVFLERYNGSGEKLETKELSPKTELNGLFYGDVDGDGVAEYTMVLIQDNTVWARYYDQDGNLLKRSPIFQLLNKDKIASNGKINITFDDFDSDGKYELIVNEKYGGRGVYGIFGKGQSVTLLTTLRNQFPNNYFVVPFVK